MSFTVPTVADFKTQFARDFPYATPATGDGGDATDDSKILNADISTGLTMAGMNINSGIFATQAQFSLGYLLLAAHYMVTNIKASNQGLFSAAFWNTIQKSAGSMQESFQIPERIQKDPYLSTLSNTQYGKQYLSLILPLLVGNVQLVCGGTTA